MKLFEKGDGLEIAVVTVDVGAPLIGTLVKIQIQHGGDRVHAQTVGVELLDPVGRV